MAYFSMIKVMRFTQTPNKIDIFTPIGRFLKQTRYHISLSRDSLGKSFRIFSFFQSHVQWNMYKTYCMRETGGLLRLNAFLTKVT